MNKTDHRNGYNRARRSRIRAVQSIFIALFKSSRISPAIERAIALSAPDFEPPGQPVDSAHYHHLLARYDTHCERAQEILQGHLLAGWTWQSMDLMLRAILITALLELLAPYDSKKGARIIVREYVDIAAGFLDDKEVAFVNKVLDAVANNLFS